MKTVCSLNNCSGCMSCIDICPKGAIQIKDELSYYNSIIDTEKCIECGMCHKICQSENPPKATVPIEWYQGWANDEKILNNASSGGFAGAISAAFINNNGIVYSCVFKNGEFVFDYADNIKDTEKFTGSKYVKSNPVDLYKRVSTDLKNGKKVLFIGLPCQVAALKNFVKINLQDNLFTVDLICHGTPSPKLLEIFLNQYNKSLKSMKSIIFRVKSKMQIHGDNCGIITKGVSDKYTIAFLNSLTYTENCYNCNYAKLERVSDITIGDSWGSSLPMEKHKKGISLALCQTKKGVKLLKSTDTTLLDVDLDNAIKYNKQLNHPSVPPQERNTFFVKLKNKKGFNSLIFKIYPKQCLKQNIKSILIHLGIIKSEK